LKKRVHEIAKQEGLTSKEVLAALTAAGIEGKVAASSVEEEEALKALAAAGATAGSKPPKTASEDGSEPQAKAAQPTRKDADGKPASDESRPRRPVRRQAGDSAPAAGPGGRKRRRVVIDS
jgi:translation initiation factor IF-2